MIALARWLLAACALGACLGAHAQAPVPHKHSPFVQSMLAGPVTPDLTTLLGQVHVLRLAGEPDYARRLAIFAEGRFLTRVLKGPVGLEPASLLVAIERPYGRGEMAQFRSATLNRSLAPVFRDLDRDEDLSRITVGARNLSGAPVTSFVATLDLGPMRYLCNAPQAGVETQPGAERETTCTVQGVAPSPQAMRDALEDARRDRHLHFKASSLRFAPGDYRLDEHDGAFVAGAKEAQALLRQVATADLQPAFGAAPAGTRVKKKAWGEEDTALAVLAVALVAGVAIGGFARRPFVTALLVAAAGTFVGMLATSVITASRVSHLGPLGNMENQLGLIGIGLEGVAYFIVGMLAGACIFLAIWLGTVVGRIGRRIFARPVAQRGQASP